jgi:hypothetical protein
MASEAQQAANRRNARKSTGPKTEAGRAVASRNALRHGLRTEHLVLFDEAPEDLARFRDGLHAALDPADEVEEELVERIVVCAWRLRRAARVEAGLFNAAADEIRHWGREARLGPAFGKAAFGIGMASRYEASLDRSLRRAYSTLERRQARRRGEPVLAPIAVEIDGLDTEPENYRTKPIPPPESAAPPAAGLGDCLTAGVAAAP